MLGKEREILLWNLIHSGFGSCPTFCFENLLLDTNNNCWRLFQGMFSVFLKTSKLSFPSWMENTKFFDLEKHEWQPFSLDAKSGQQQLIFQTECSFWEMQRCRQEFIFHAWNSTDRGFWLFCSLSKSRVKRHPLSSCLSLRSLLVFFSV
jgi:hypothetical protein